MEKFYKYIVFSAIFLPTLFILQFLSRHDPIKTIILSGILISYQIFILWRFARWLTDENGNNNTRRTKSKSKGKDD